MYTNRPIVVSRTARLNEAPKKRAKTLVIASLLVVGAALFAAQAAFAQTKPKKDTPAATQPAAAPEAASAATTGGDSMLTSQATELYTAADGGSPVVEKLSAKTPVRAFEQKSKWRRVITGTNATGWVNLMHLRGEPVIIASGSDSGVLSGVASFLGGPGGSQKSQGATLGIRGLTEEELKNAAPDLAALAKVRSFKSDTGEAERFAREASLKKADASFIDSDGRPIAPKS